jgi:hypothetical protein
MRAAARREEPADGAHEAAAPPFGYAATRRGLLIPETSAEAPGRRVVFGALACARALWGLRTTLFPTAVTVALIGAAVAVHSAQRSARATVQAALCTSAHAERREALAADRAVASDTARVIERCRHAAGWPELPRETADDTRAPGQVAIIP